MSVTPTPNPPPKITARHECRKPGPNYATLIVEFGDSTFYHKWHLLVKIIVPGKNVLAETYLGILYCPYCGQKLGLSIDEQLEDLFNRPTTS